MSELHEIQGNRGDWFFGEHPGICSREAWISKQSYIVRIKLVGGNFWARDSLPPIPGDFGLCLKPRFIQKTSEYHVRSNEKTG